MCRMLIAQLRHDCVEIRRGQVGKALTPPLGQQPGDDAETHRDGLHRDRLPASGLAVAEEGVDGVGDRAAHGRG